MSILAIDPGTTRSAWVWLEGGDPIAHGIDDNEALVEHLREWAPVHVVIEKVESFGMPVGAEVFETVRWAGRFEEAVRPNVVHRLGRKAVKVAICGTSQAKDPNIRQALIDRWGGRDAIRKGGPLHGIRGDEWAALAVAVAWEGGAR